MLALDIQTKLGMSLDDLATRARGGGRRIQGGIVGKRSFHRSMPYTMYQPRESNGYGQRPGRSRVSNSELCNNCRRPGHFARDCPNAAVCNNCGLSGHIAALCSVEPLCRNCKKPGHIARECRSEPVCNSCGRPGHLAKGCAAAWEGGAAAGGLPKAWLCNNCYRPGHVAADCSNDKACNNCRQAGHLVRDCFNSPVCNGCSQTGHIARDCPRLLTAAPTADPDPSPRSTPLHFSDTMVCHNCHQPGHRSKECLQVTICNNCGGRGHLAIECPSDPMLTPRGLWRR